MLELNTDFICGGCKYAIRCIYMTLSDLVKFKEGRLCNFFNVAAGQAEHQGPLVNGPFVNLILMWCYAIILSQGIGACKLLLAGLE